MERHFNWIQSTAQEEEMIQWSYHPGSSQEPDPNTDLLSSQLWCSPSSLLSVNEKVTGGRVIRSLLTLKSPIQKSEVGHGQVTARKAVLRSISFFPSPFPLLLLLYSPSFYLELIVLCFLLILSSLPLPLLLMIPVSSSLLQIFLETISKYWLLVQKKKAM